MVITLARVETIKIEGYGTEINVTLRRWSWGSDQDAVSKCTDFDIVSRRTKLDGKLYNELMQEKCIVDWDIKGQVKKDDKDSWVEYDANGEKIPISTESIRALDVSIGRKIMAKLLEMNTLTKEDKTFLSKSPP